MAISAPGIDTRTFDNCEYLHAIAASGGAPALAYGETAAVASGAPTTGPSPSGNGGEPAASGGLSTIGVIAVVVIAILLIGLGFGLSRRRSAGRPG